jgi:hypothetical protein
MRCCGSWTSWRPDASVPRPHALRETRPWCRVSSFLRPRRHAMAKKDDSPCCARRRRWVFPAHWSAPVAQLDRAPDYESGGQEFESLRARQSFLKVIRTLSQSPALVPGFSRLGVPRWSHVRSRVYCGGIGRKPTGSFGAWLGRSEHLTSDTRPQAQPFADSRHLGSGGTEFPKSDRSTRTTRLTRTTMSGA